MKTVLPPSNDVGKPVNPSLLQGPS